MITARKLLGSERQRLELSQFSLKFVSPIQLNSLSLLALDTGLYAAVNS